MELSLNQKLGLIIRNIRKHKSISQFELSQKLNYSQSVLSKVEQGYEDIHPNTYVMILKTMDMNVVFDPLIEIKVNRLMKKLYDAMLYLDLPVIESIMNEFDEIMPNALYYYDYLLCELVQNFILDEFEECFIIVNELSPYISICTEESKLIFNLLNTILTSMNYQEIKLKPINPLHCDKQDGLMDYFNGMIYLYQFNYTVSLNYLLKANHTFKEQQNIKRLGKVEIMINNILMKENDYFDIEIRTKALLSEYERYFNQPDRSALCFQLAYSFYYQRKYTDALAILETLINQNFIFKKLVDYMIYKCQVQLGHAPSKLSHVLVDLFTAYQENIKDAHYYDMIETHILPKLKQNLFIKEFQLYTLDLMNYYFQQKQYKKYKKLTDEFTILYKVI